MEDKQEFSEANLGVPEKAIIHLYNSVERLNFSITKLLKLFETAKIEPEHHHTGKVILKIKEVADQNEKIAKGIISLANIVREQTSEQPDFQKILEKIDRLEMLIQTAPKNTEDYSGIIARLDEIEEQVQKFQMMSPEPVQNMPEPIQKIPLKQLRKPQPKMPPPLIKQPEPEFTIEDPDVEEPQMLKPNRRMNPSAPPAFRGLEEPEEIIAQPPEDEFGEFKFSEGSQELKLPDEPQVPPITSNSLEGIEELEIPKPPQKQKSFLSKLRK